MLNRNVCRGSVTIRVYELFPSVQVIVITEEVWVQASYLYVTNTRHPEWVREEKWKNCPLIIHICILFDIGPSVVAPFPTLESFCLLLFYPNEWKKTNYEAIEHAWSLTGSKDEKRKTGTDHQQQRTQWKSLLAIRFFSKRKGWIQSEHHYKNDTDDSGKYTSGWTIMADRREDSSQINTRKCATFLAILQAFGSVRKWNVQKKKKNLVKMMLHPKDPARENISSI